MKHPVKTLATLAILGAMAPSVHAVSIKDDVVTLTPTVRLQTRAQMNDATSATGGDYRVMGGTAGAVDEPLDFYMRRARLGMNFNYGSNWKGQIQINADNVDANNKATADRNIVLRYAWLERTFKLDDGMSHSFTFGLQKPHNMNPSDAMSSSAKLLVNDTNGAQTFVNSRGVGLNYRFDHNMFNLAAALMNNTNGTKNVTGAAAQEEEGFFYGLRAEFSFSPEWYIKRRAESFLGKEGHGLNVGLSFAANDDAVTAATSSTSSTAYGVDVLFWLNGLSAYAEYRAGTVTTDLFAGGSTDVDHEYIVLQAGYAITTDFGVIEPAIRYQIIDTNTDVDTVSEYGNNGENGGAGTQIDLGINLYLAGHANKFQLGVSFWEAEAGEADATIIRLQHQINF